MFKLKKNNDVCIKKDVFLKNTRVDKLGVDKIVVDEVGSRQSVMIPKYPPLLNN